ncbi:TPA: hypothetical protein DCZ46_01200 [Candidatus Campbellbacteria bacterium]|nr:MAG: protein of unknown function with transmembrane region [Candidatus Campbellbacteria bacterium GW2011_OD1_34_28]KKP75298.1 MAG: hypothetical protein UR74_C0001G0154 [Candidatus Campbellbacteria bacterium GW2011_GWD2_35_24]KKP76141.1 MAG: hypothetical protein UR75_C0001G0175 [Candidatus Campbellbacteria bacterium GW2011_GWC2_35_28]KKP77330.1 MAG: hypothetical protein UR76_C0001G0175 [Candidatus Campbellbacteria bacterium GW2011_GWC1_35_31]KKP79259.1 MAG: hypothetical protein UR79_C0001G017
MKNIYKFILILVVVVGVSFYFGNSPAENISAANNEHAGDVSGCSVTATTLTGAKEYGEDQGRTNGCRPTFFFDMSGDGYCPGGKCSVDISCEDGDAETYTFDNPGVPPGECPPGANWNGAVGNSPGRYPLVYWDLEGFLWKSKGNTYCKLVVYLPQKFGTGECEPDFQGSPASPADPAETLMDLVNEWRDISEKIHRSGDLAAAQDEYDEIKAEMDAIKKEALQIVPEGSCDYIIYGDDPGFHHYNPHSFDSAKSAIVLCPLSPELVSCTGFVPNINPLTGKMWPDKNRQIFIQGTPKSGPLTINCLGKDGETYSYRINDGNTYTNGVCQ